MCCPANSRPKTRRESAPCCVANPREVSNLVPVRALPDADFAGFPTRHAGYGICRTLRCCLQNLSYELTGQDTSGAIELCSLGTKGSNLISGNVSDCEVMARSQDDHAASRGARASACAFRTIHCRPRPTSGMRYVAESMACPSRANAAGTQTEYFPGAQCGCKHFVIRSQVAGRHAQLQ